jgi:hypothetical protein
VARRITASDAVLRAIVTFLGWLKNSVAAAWTEDATRGTLAVATGVDAVVALLEGGLHDVVAAHPSPDAVLPSSHSSEVWLILPSPQ